jgi:hypothetical protein
MDNRLGSNDYFKLDAINCERINYICRRKIPMMKRIITWKPVIKPIEELL